MPKRHGATVMTKPQMQTQRSLSAAETRIGPGGTTSKAEHAYRTLRHSIVSGEFEPGGRLVIEQIARAIDTSVVPVREAIRRLEAEGYVVYARNVGATVASVDLAHYPDTIEVVALLEGAATGLAAPHLSGRDIKTARSLNAELGRLLQKPSPVLFSETNRRFHETLFQRCPNGHLLELLEKEWVLLQQTRRAAFALMSDRAAQSVDEHECLLRMIEERRAPEEIEAHVRDHRHKTAKALLAAIAADDIDEPHRRRRRSPRRMTERSEN
jgi:DNA-binding GntR family transcriptional regulator